LCCAEDIEVLPLLPKAIDRVSDLGGSSSKGFQYLPLSICFGVTLTLPSD
jgi:hypothetical protein